MHSCLLLHAPPVDFLPSFAFAMRRAAFVSALVLALLATALLSLTPSLHDHHADATHRSGFLRCVEAAPAPDSAGTPTIATDAGIIPVITSQSDEGGADTSRLPFGLVARVALQ